MIRKAMLTLLLLIILASIGIVALVIFIDPNSFKGFISATVRDKTGYELTIDGDLRWHVWPQVSILTDSVRLVDEGANKPILIADNMRLDVELLPLFSKTLSVKNVLVKSAIINLTDESRGNIAKGGKPTTAINQSRTANQNQITDQNQTRLIKDSEAHWSFSLNQLDIVDSTVIYQQNNDTISFRDINVAVRQKNDKNVVVDLSGSVNRDQQNLIYSLNADVSLANFPQSASVKLHQLTYNYQGSQIPTGQLKGEISATFDYQKSPLMLASQDLTLMINGNKIHGQLNANLDRKPYVEVLLQADQFDLTPFLIANSASSKKGDTPQTSQSRPVVLAKTKRNELAFLTDFDAKINLTVNNVIANNAVINNFELDATNKEGIATLNNMSLDIAKGHIRANGLANGSAKTAVIKLTTQVTDIDLAVLLTQLALKSSLNGQLNASGTIATNTVAPEKIINSLTGDLTVSVNNTRVDNFDIEGIIQATLLEYAKSQSTKDVITPQEYQKYTELHDVSAKAKIAHSDINLSAIKASSAALDITGNGQLSLTKPDLDFDLQVKLLSGFHGESKTIQQLQKVAIPLHIYGTFNELHYQVNTEKMIKNMLNNKLQNLLLQGNLLQNGSNEQPKTKEVIGGLINKIKEKRK